jgi:hypothetical protein
LDDDVDEVYQEKELSPSFAVDPLLPSILVQDLMT